MKKKHLGNGGGMKEEEVRISSLRWEGRQLGRSASTPGGLGWGGLEKLSFTFA